MITLFQTTKDAWAQLIALPGSEEFNDLFDQENSNLELYINATGVEEFINEINAACTTTSDYYCAELYEAEMEEDASLLENIESEKAAVSDAVDSFKEALFEEFPENRYSIAQMYIY